MKSLLNKTPRILGAVFLCIALLVAAIQWQLSPMHAGSTAPIKCDISIGSSTRSVSGILKSCKLIRNSMFFELYVRLTGQASQLKAGTYVLNAGQTLPEIADSVANGEALSNDLVVTTPEGMNIWEVAKTLQQAGLIPEPAAFVRAYLGSEGKLYPETYRFAPGTTLAGIAQRMIDTYDAHDGQPGGEASVTRDQLIVASILEKEAKTKDDMAIVSGVIARRMALGMPLQIDATVAYGACRRIFQIQSSNKLCDVTQIGVAKEIKIDSPYNTYMRKGLPVGPIANPGSNALWAAAHPQSSDYLYYLSTRDGSQIIYSKTLAEHLKNRAKYLGL